MLIAKEMVGARVLAGLELVKIRRRNTGRLMQHTYERPTIWALGTVRELTLMPQPPGKSGPSHDGSQFLSNFSCVGKDSSNCGDH